MWFPLAPLLLVLVLLSAGCYRSDTGVASTQPISQVRIGYFPNLTHAQAVLGVASGDFAAAVAPAKLTPRLFNAGPALIEALFANQIDIGYVGPGPAINAFVQSHGQGIRVVAGAAADGVVIVARKDSGINTLADLAGHKLATPQRANTQDIAARHYLTAVLHQQDTNNVLPIRNADQLGMMARGNIDAAWVPEPWAAMEIAQNGARLIAEEKDLWPNKTFSLTVVVTTPEFLATHRDVVEKVLKVNRTWTARLNDDSARYVPQLEQTLARLTGKNLPAGVTADALRRVKFTDEPSFFTFEANAKWAYDLGFAREKPDLFKLMDSVGVLQKSQKQ